MLASLNTRRSLDSRSRRKNPPKVVRSSATSGEANERHARIMALLDELADFAAGLWLAGKLDDFPPQEVGDADDH